jgi:TolB-like protein/Flp pilus assembly protein TadD
VRHPKHSVGNKGIVRFRFSNCELDTTRHQLLVGGVERAAEPQVFDLLRHLLENPDRLISHDELIEKIWQGRIVSDSAVSARISAARSAIGDDGARQSMIKTVPRRGFQFVAEVEVLPEGSQTPQPSQLPEKPSIAVLALENLSGDPEQEYFSDGIAEDITAALSRFQELFVIARNSSFTYKGLTVTTKQVADDLGVKYILEGSVRRARDKVRVTVQLIDAQTDRNIWADHYDRGLDDIFAVQDEITRQVVAAVAPETLNAEIAHATVKLDVDLTDWERVMKARWLMGKITRRHNDAAAALLAETIANAPHMAIAHSFSALCYVNDLLHGWNLDPTSAIVRAGAAAQRAVDLDDNDASAFAVLGLAGTYARNYDDALEHLAHAIRLNANLANAYGMLAVVHGFMGEYEKSVQAMETAFTLSPRDRGKLFWLAGKGIGAYITKRYEEVIDNARAMLRENPNFGAAHRHLAAALAMVDRDKEAADAMARLRELMPELTISQVRQMVPVKDPNANERWLEGLRRAGLPE